MYCACCIAALYAWIEKFLFPLALQKSKFRAILLRDGKSIVAQSNFLLATFFHSAPKKISKEPRGKLRSRPLNISMRGSWERKVDSRLGRRYLYLFIYLGGVEVFCLQALVCIYGGSRNLRITQRNPGSCFFNIYIYSFACVSLAAALLAHKRYRKTV